MSPRAAPPRRCSRGAATRDRNEATWPGCGCIRSAWGRWSPARTRRCSSEDVESWKTGFCPQAIVKIHRDAGVACPQRIAPLVVVAPGGASLLDRGHGKGARTLKPARVAGELVELEERIAVAGGTVAKVRALGERPGAPDQLARAHQQTLELGRHERRIGEARDHARRAVAPLDEHRGVLFRASGPIYAVVCLARVQAERTHDR